MTGITAEREAVVTAITNVGAQAVRFEAFGGMDDDPEDAYTSQVASSDIYLEILGSRYGEPLKTGYSATHAEYNEPSNGRILERAFGSALQRHLGDVQARLA